MKRILATIAAGIAVVVAVPAPANAGIDTVGWYTRNPAASAPEGGLQVANAPDGVVSYGAIGVMEAADTISKATLTLTETGQNLNAAAAKLQACPAAGSFKNGKGTFADGPKADCAIGKVDLTRAGNGVWTGDVTSVLRGDPAAVAIVPAQGAGVFQVNFTEPDLELDVDAGGSGSASSFDASEFGGSGGSSSSTDSGSPSAPSDSSSFDPGSSGSSGGSSSFEISSGSSTFSPSTFDATTAAGGGATEPAAATAAPAPADATAAGTEVAGGTNLPTRRNLSATAASATTDGNRGVQFLFFALTAAVIGTGAGFARNRFVTAKG